MIMNRQSLFSSGYRHSLRYGMDGASSTQIHNISIPTTEILSILKGNVLPMRPRRTPEQGKLGDAISLPLTIQPHRYPPGKRMRDGVAYAIHVLLGRRVLSIARKCRDLTVCDSCGMLCGILYCNSAALMMAYRAVAVECRVFTELGNVWSK